ncbi:glycosyltransferase [Salinimonas marina]|uniref:Glycosyltransferase n=1 Tax=Salinimonas marina TaxID=2785918 RepID=A0A7S9DXZ6_9ALTE|nr:glycosyltransferase [Salinimonas marina]QPG06024.1 glycosyltransferase [Salinimonas marina]
MSDAVPQELLKAFDPIWYLATYPDVEKAGIDPLSHFEKFGWKEGRWPYYLEAVMLDEKLWGNRNTEDYCQQLQRIAENTHEENRGLACWFLCRWFASHGEWDAAKPFVEGMLNDSYLPLFIRHEGPFLLAFTVCLKALGPESAKAVLNNSRWAASANKTLAFSMLTHGKAKIDSINQIFEQPGLLRLADSETPTLDSITSNVEQRVGGTNALSPTVSVIIPCFNAEKTIATALSSLINQTYPKLEILVVDDASTDHSFKRVQEFVTRDKRVRYLRLSQNSGAYAARNLALKSCRGAFITTHDADDWSHPQKIEKQVEALQKNRRIKATVSHWVRTDEALNFERWRMEEGWIYRNVSSLMFRRSVFRKLGYWDTVSVNADTEYYHRIQKKFGHGAIEEVMPGLPLAFGRVDAGSLTQTGATHLRTQFNGIRKDYQDAAAKWHANARRLYMPQYGLRFFTAPPLICRGTVEARRDNLKRILQEKGLFHRDWYLNAYPDIAKAGVDPLTHFIAHGIDEGRDPNPYLSTSGLAYTTSSNHFDAISRWASQPIDPAALVSISGHTETDSKTGILMVGHLAGNTLFGAERSFLDCVKMLASKNSDISVVLPGGVNHSYINDLLPHVKKIYFTPLPWWRNGRAEICEVTDQISNIIQQTDATVVYVNTLTLWEPHIAARTRKCKSVMHVRELPAHDKDLCERLNSTPEQIRLHIDRNTDWVIANSQVTADYVALENKATVIYNSVERNKIESERDSETSLPLSVAMLSSNTLKKGIADLFHVAKLAAEMDLPVRFSVYGPDTPELQARMTSYAYNNLTYCGYVARPYEALKNADVILSLSHFQESFGRTVVEGMLAGCIPVGYAWGALPEVVDSSVGHLVPFGDYEEIVNTLKKLTEGTDQLAELKQYAKSFASARFNDKQIGDALYQTLTEVASK